MNGMRLIRFTVLAGLSSIALFCGRVNATSMVAINLAQTVELGKQAFVGQVRDVQTTHTAKGWGEQITCDVLENVYETTAGQPITWIQARSSEQYRIIGMPQFKPGEVCLIFLFGRAPGSLLQAPVGLDQGVFRFEKPASDSETPSKVMNAY